MAPMLSVHLTVYIILNAVYLTYGQYVVDTKLTPAQAESFCTSHCGSSFGSIHSEQQFVTTQSSVNYDAGTDGIWIGLKAAPHPLYSWSDGTTLDFASDLSGGAYPWASNEPFGSGEESKCVAMSSPSFEWFTSSQCNIPRRVLCNDCNGKLSKYTLLHADVSGVGYTYSEAKFACSTYFEYGLLASIHTTRDWREAKRLCSAFNTTSQSVSCWIGLTDLVNEGEFVYEDGTNFNFGSNTFTTPNEHEDCVRLSSSNNYYFDDYACNGGGTGDNNINYALCYLPSELCSSKAIWTRFNGNYGGDCQLSIDAGTDIVMANKMWYNGNEPLIIEYTYKFSITDTTQHGDSGIVIYNDIERTVCKYYYVFVQKTSTNHFDVGILYQSKSKAKLLDIARINFVFNESDYNILSIHVTDGNKFSVYINDIQFINYDDSIRNTTNIVFNHGYSGYIGIKTGLYTKVDAHSLYISGTGASTGNDFLSIDSSCPTLSPSLSPTPSPTPNPTDFPSPGPTNNPSVHPTISPTNNPSIFPTNTPSKNPSQFPSDNPTTFPSHYPSSNPSVQPTLSPSVEPTTSNPTYTPSTEPTSEPTLEPTSQPTTEPITPKPTMEPTAFTSNPSASQSETTAKGGEGNNNDMNITDVVATSPPDAIPIDRANVGQNKSMSGEQVFWATLVAVGFVLLCVSVVYMAMTHRKQQREKAEKVGDDEPDPEEQNMHKTHRKNKSQSSHLVADCEQDDSDDDDDDDDDDDEVQI